LQEDENAFIQEKPRMYEKELVVNDPKNVPKKPNIK
jgi:hypothetical protein